MLKFILLLSFYNLLAFSIEAQSRQNIEATFLEMRKVITGVGVVSSEIVVEGRDTSIIKRYSSIGSGLVTYVKIDTLIVPVVITAGHVIKYYLENNIKEIFIRPSWADTINTKQYFGLKIPVLDSNKYENYILYPDTTVDLGCILMLPIYYDKVFNERLIKEKLKILPFNSMSIPYLGEQVWIGGYPGHVQGFSNTYYYSISTFKPGYIVWKPSINMENPDLKHRIFVESNATFGNSGGPVFSISEDLNLVGILIGGLSDKNSLLLGDKELKDSASNLPYITETRAGVSYIIKAEYVKKFIEYIRDSVK